MKFSAALALIVFVGLVASSAALPARKRVVYLAQQPQWYGAPQRLMYLPNRASPSYKHSRYTQASAALVDFDSAEAGLAEDALDAAGEAVQSVAVANPEENDAQVADDVPADVADVESAIDNAEVEVQAAEVEVPAEETAAVASNEAEAQNDEDDDDDEVAPAPVVPARRPSKAAQNAGAKPAKAPLPAGTFFPIEFGGASGGAIAIANAFSTGEGGSATSHAIANGSPSNSARSRPSKIH